MAYNEIHNYENESLTPSENDFMDIDADIGGGNWLSKKLKLSNLRNWLFKLVSQDVFTINSSTTPNINITLGINAHQVFEIINNSPNLGITIPNNAPYGNSATYVAHIYNNSGGDIIFSSQNIITTPNNPPITTTIGGYAQVWITYHKKADNSEHWTANTINFT